MEWPLEDGQQASKLPFSFSLEYTDQNSIEKTYTATVADEVIPIPASTKALVLRAKTNDVDIKLNGASTVITLKAGAGYLIITNPDGNITGVTATVTTATAVLEGYAFA
jgi:hypothetical protein